MNELWWEFGRAAALRDEPVTSFFGVCRHASSTAGCSTALTMLDARRQSNSQRLHVKALRVPVRLAVVLLWFGRNWL